jgi:hypothetical protein
LFPVVYDTDGSIIDSVLGTGAKNGTLGFAGSSFFLSPNCRYIEGRAVINGFLNTSDTTLTVTLAHEIGHMIGMDHIQLGTSQGLANTSRPLMYPIASRGSATLHEDDESAISALYPEALIGSMYGELNGTFVLADGVTAVRGANIWATETTTGRLYSVVSDYRTQGTGFFRMLVPPGQYRLRAEAVLSSFVGGSSVGPFSEVATDPSFQSPLYVGGTPMAVLTLGNGTPTNIAINAGCVANVTFRFDGTGAVGGNCSAPTAYPLAVTKTGTGTGTVSSSVGGINCGTTCLALFSTGTMVTLTATASGGSVFAGWSGPCSGTGSCNVTVNNLTSVSALFYPPAAAAEVFPASCLPPSGWQTPAGATKGWIVATDRSRTGLCSLKSDVIGNTNVIGTFQKAQIETAANFQAGNLTFYYNVSSEASYDCLRFFLDDMVTPRAEMGSNCAQTGGAGQSGEVTAWTLVTVPISAGAHTLRWSYEKDYTVSNGQDAAWIDEVALPPLAPVTLTVTKSGNGAGTASGTGISCGADCTEPITPGTMVTLTATPSTGSTFTGWSGGGCTGTGTCQVTVNADTTVTATFTLNQYLLSVSKNGTGTGTVTSPSGINCGADCSETLNHGSMVTLTATPAMGSSFANWSGGGCGMVNPCVVTLTAATTVTATFNISAVAPGAPTLDSLTAGNSQAIAFFTAPASDGGAPITLYTVQCPDAAAVQPTAFATGTTSPITVTGMVNGVTYNCRVIATNSAGNSLTSNQISVTPSASPPFGFVSADSRKTHGGVTKYKVPITIGPLLNGAISVEPRSGSSHEIVFTFNGTVTSVGSVSTSVGSASSTFSGTELSVVLNGVPDNSRVAVTVNGVNGSVSQTANIGFMAGDVSNSRSVSAVDIAAVKSRSGNTVTTDAQARFDIMTNGTINNVDISAVKAKSGQVLP